jgi:K+/H+ antiporter YhaU regulatory subunit KhtT
MLETHEQKSRVRLVTTIVAIIVIAGAVVLADHFKSQNEPTSSVAQNSTANTPVTTTTNSTSTSTAANNGTFKDGTYNATEKYTVPHGTEQIAVTATLTDGVVTDISIKNSESDFDSQQYQEEFAAGYKTKVIGKKISDLKISVIAGASDTTEAFNDALVQIATKTEA